MGFFKSLFGPSKAEIWKQMAADIGGEYIDGGFWGGDALVYRHNDWELVLDTYTESCTTGVGENKTETTRTCTRLRAPFLNMDNLQFEIYPEGFFSFISKLLGTQDIQIGDDFFDGKFIIQGNNHLIIKELLSNEELKKLFLKRPDVHIKIDSGKGWFSNEYPEGISVLYSECHGVLVEKETLQNMFNLFAAILDRLTEIDSGYGEKPYFRLR